jgi:hypothetical protein
MIAPAREPLSFSVHHAGRGGDVTCRCDAGELLLPIEGHSPDGFSVWMRGARLTSAEGETRRLRTAERKLVLARLRAWLDATGRERWVIEA